MRARGGKGGFDTARGIRWSHRENVALADNLRLMVRKLQAQRLAKMRSLRSRISGTVCSCLRRNDVIFMRRMILIRFQLLLE
jgi:hypothetical protein